MRISLFVATAFLIGAAALQGVQAQDFSGKWSVSGQLISGRMVMSIGQICDLRQTGDQVAGTCRGPNAGCSAVGVANGPRIDMTCRTIYTNAPGFAGFSTFHGTLGRDDIVRGTWGHSRYPGASGPFAMQRV